MLESTPEHKCENDNETGFTEPPDISFDWLSSTASDARQACRRRIYSILSQSDGDEASLAAEKVKCAATFMHMEEE